MEQSEEGTARHVRGELVRLDDGEVHHEDVALGRRVRAADAVPDAQLDRVHQVRRARLHAHRRERERADCGRTSLPQATTTRTWTAMYLCTRISDTGCQLSATCSHPAISRIGLRNSSPRALGCQK